MIGGVRRVRELRDGVRVAVKLFHPGGTAEDLADFGIAKAFDGAAATEAGMVVGTAAFLAPEQARELRSARPPTSPHWAWCCWRR